MVSLGGGQMFGEVAFFRRALCVGARENTRVLWIPFAALDRLLVGGRPALAFMQHVATSLAHHAGQIAARLDRPYFRATRNG